MKFYKYCGAGNDFILLENYSGALSPERCAALAKQLCRLHFSVGADGLIVLERANNGGDCAMRFFNCDGSPAEMCGNGARCVCRHCHDSGLAGQVQYIETPAGLVVGKRIAEDQYEIRLPDPCAIRPFTAEGASGIFMELGENGIPHAVVLADVSGKRAELREFARKLRFSEQFPHGANVNLCAVIGANAVRLLTYERGVEDFTLACGTGTGATVAALVQQGLVSGKETTVQTDGGLLQVSMDADGLFLTGPAERVFVGETEK